MVDVLSLADLLDLATAPAALAPYSPLTAQPFLLIGSAAPPAAADQALICAWLARQPCPVLGLPGSEAVHAACDAVVADAELPAVIRTIAAAPIAAMVLVQLLRATETLSIAGGLAAESLAYATLQAGPEFKHWLAGRPPHPPDERRDTGPPVVLEAGAAGLEIRLNRPARWNALSLEMRDALVEAFQLVAADRGIVRARVTAKGRCFSIGGDLAEFGTTPDPATGHLVRSLRLPAAALALCAERVEFHLHGACIGAGIELPAFAHRVTATRNAFFQLPELRFGLMPGAGGCISLPRRIGRRRTAYMALSGRRITAAKALEWGLIDGIME
jgi:enoyl-CoA hydratase/carnithine racemase